MLAINYSTLRNNLKTYCDRAFDDDEVVVVTRKSEKNVVVLGLDQYNRLMKAARNAEYLAQIDRALEQLASGKGQRHELIDVDD